MSELRSRITDTWRSTVSLSWPIAVQQLLNTLMRSVDIVVTGLFSPAAVAAIGLADLYAQVPFRIGRALGTGAIALSSQDTARGDAESRDQAVTQALLIGFLIGVPIVAVGFSLSEFLIEVLGAEKAVVRMGSLYLALVFAVAPLRIVALVGARSLQGTGDTRTPLVVNGLANVVNIFATVGLGLGLLGLPRLGIVGVGMATALSRGFECVAMLGMLVSNRTDLSLSRPRDSTVTKQLIAIGLPNFAEGMSTSVANFPFNALLLVFGTEVSAAYHIGRRIYQQLAGPLYRSYSVAASIMVGQRLGEGNPEEARFSGLAITAFSVLTLGAIGALISVGAEPLSSMFTDDPDTLGYAVEFTRISGVSMLFFGIFFPLAGSLQGASETRTPFYARFTGTFGFMLGFSYLVGIWFGYGLSAVYLGVVLTYVWWAIVACAGFLWGDWAEKAEQMMAKRTSTAD
ncbi:putative efflux protein, MATE family [Halogranum rubrum]|uniref:Multidrug-efflux transporter n=1 Tax=Halogranum rubrum TaxID=553466 RepID=A0A1I4JPS8_9EURY|nr:MATE family efflux transporter [Halogranum rubrum]SFL68542.1 putative efflux protein, MATE family [Halogranum rubrum]